MASQFFGGLFKHKVSNAALTDTTAPTFAGAANATANADGSITLDWAAATDPTTPLSYLVYISPGVVPSGTLFVGSNIVTISPILSAKLYVDATGTALIQGMVYTLGVRARDGVGNTGSNVVTKSATSQGVPSNSLFNLITAVKAKSDVMTFDGSNYLNVHTKVNDDKTNYTISGVDKAALVSVIWNELQAGYVTADTFGANLNATITSRATQTSVDSIQNNTLFVGVVPPVLLLPALGDASKDYRFFIRLFDTNGDPADSDDQVMQVRVQTVSGTVLNFGDATRTTQGNWFYDYTVASTDTEQPLVVEFEYLRNAQVLLQSRTTEVQEHESKLDTLLARITSGRAAALDLLDASITSRADQASVDQVIAQTDAQVIANSVWDEVLSAHQVSGSAGLLLSQSTGAGIAASVWGLLRSGNQGAGTFGEIMDALISSRSSQTSIGNLQVSVDGLQSNPNQFVGTVEEDGVIVGSADTGQ